MFEIMMNCIEMAKEEVAWIPATKKSFAMQTDIRPTVECPVPAAERSSFHISR